MKENRKGTTTSEEVSHYYSSSPIVRTLVQLIPGIGGPADFLASIPAAKYEKRRIEIQI